MHKYEFSKGIESSFTGKNLTGNGGMLIIGEFLLDKVNLKGLLSKSIKEKGNSKRIKHRKLDIILQKIFSTIVGYSTNNVDEYIKNDPIFKTLLGKIVPKTTVNRIINTFGGKVKNALQRVIQEVELYNLQISGKKEVLIDVDTSFDPASANIGGIKYNTHYSTSCYSPIFAFDGLTGDLIRGELRPGNYACSKDVVKFIKPIVEFYKKHKIKMSFRFDSGFGTPELYEYLDKEKITYQIKLKKNNILNKNAEKILQENNISCGDNLISEFKYKASSWDIERRVITCIDWFPKETTESEKDTKNKKGAKQLSLFANYSFVVTNDISLKPEEVISKYNGRATVETLIEEAKNGFFVDKLSHKKFEINSSAFQIQLLTMQVTQLFRKMTLGIKRTTEELKKVYTDKEHAGKFKGIAKVGRKVFKLPTIQTLRKTLIEIPTYVAKGQDKLKFRFEETFGGKELYNSAMVKLKGITTLQL